MIKYKRTKDFEVDQIKILFSSVEWFSGNFPEKLQIALSNSSRVNICMGWREADRVD